MQRPVVMLLLLLLLSCGNATPAVEVVTGSEAGGLPNAYLILGKREALLIDTLERRSDVAKLAGRIEKSGRTLTTIFVTHAHGDHLLGLAQLLERFPKAKAVTTAGVLADAKTYEIGLFSNSTHTHGAEAPKRMVMPSALTGETLQFEGKTYRVLSFENGESTHAAALYDPETRTLFAGDLVYSGVHLNLSEKRIAGWRAQLARLDKLDLARIYPGHGPVADRKVIAENRRYLDDFAAALETPTAPSIRQRMLARYPRHRLPQNLERSIRAFVMIEE